MSRYNMTAIELQKFREDGFAGPFDLYNVKVMKANYKKIWLSLFDRSHAIYYLANNSKIAGYDRHFDIDFFSQHIIKKDIVGKLLRILGPDIICWRSQIYPKYPGDKGQDWYQDDVYLDSLKQTQLIWPANEIGRVGVTVWTALTDVTEDSGCLRFIPATQEKILYDKSKIKTMGNTGLNKECLGYNYNRQQGNAAFSAAEKKALSITMKAGQFIIFFSTLIQARFANRTTNKTQLGFAAKYVPASVKVYPSMKRVEECGSVFSLDKYRVVVVAGKDRYGHNKVG